MDCVKYALEWSKKCRNQVVLTAAAAAGQGTKKIHSLQKRAQNTIHKYILNIFRSLGDLAIFIYKHKSH